MSSDPRRVFSLPRRSARRISDDFDRELAFHIDMRVADLVERGTDPGEARRIASAECGDLDEARRYVGAIDTETQTVAHRRLTMDGISQEVVGAMRRLRRARGFTVTAVLTLSLGVAACALMLNIVSGVLLAPLPFRDAAQVAMIWGYIPQMDLGYPEQPLNGAYFTTIRDNIRHSPPSRRFAPVPTTSAMSRFPSGSTALRRPGSSSRRWACRRKRANSSAAQMRRRDTIAWS